MDFDRYIQINLEIAVKMVNDLTPGYARGSVVPVAESFEARLAAVRKALEIHDDMAVSEQALDMADVEGVYSLAENLREIFSATSLDIAARSVGKLLLKHQAAPTLIKEKRTVWRLHFHAADAAITHARGAGCATAMAVLIESNRFERIGVCQAQQCDRVYFDESRNGSKRFCSTACTNRSKTAQFRKRQLEAQKAGASETRSHPGR